MTSIKLEVLRTSWGVPCILDRGWDSFIEWKQSLQLLDIPFRGSRFTWTNNQQGDGLILERLDRAYATQAWLEEFPTTIVRHLPITTSDHAPVLLQTSPPRLDVHRPYQIEIWCLLHPDIVSIIEGVWNMSIVGSPMYIISRKLDIIRRKLKVWCLDRRLFWGINWKRIMYTLDREGKDISTISQGNLVQTSRRHLMDEVAMAETYWQQRVREKQIKWGDVPSTLLYNRLKHRQTHNALHMLRDVNGDWVDTPDAIHKLVFDHFKNLYTGTPVAANGHDTIS